MTTPPFSWPERDDDLAQAEAYADGGEAPSRKAMGRIASQYRSVEATLEGSRAKVAKLESLAAVVEKIIVAGNPLVFRGGHLANGPGLAFEGMWVPLDPDDFLAVIQIVNKIQEERRDT